MKNPEPIVTTARIATPASTARLRMGNASQYPFRSALKCIKTPAAARNITSTLSKNAVVSASPLRKVVRSVMRSTAIATPATKSVRMSAQRRTQISLRDGSAAMPFAYKTHEEHEEREENDDGCHLVADAALIGVGRIIAKRVRKCVIYVVEDEENESEHAPIECDHRSRPQKEIFRRCFWFIHRRGLYHF